MVRTVAAAGVIAELVLLWTLDAAVGLSLIGWLTGTACGLGVNAAVQRGLTRTGRQTLGPADWVTLTRATLVGAVTALVAQSFARPVSITLLVALAAVALVLDAVDGRVARSTDTASPFGARFDMEVDAFLILVLSVEATRTVGPWVLAIGAARYAFVAAGWLWPWLTAATPPRYWCKVVAAIQGVTLTVAVADVLQQVSDEVVLAAALALLTESFGRDVWWLWSRHRLLPYGRVEQPAMAAVSG